MSILLHIWPEKGDPAGTSLPLDPSSVPTAWRGVGTRSLGVLHAPGERPRKPTTWEARHGVLFATPGAMRLVSFRDMFRGLPSDLDSDLHAFVSPGKVSPKSSGQAGTPGPSRAHPTRAYKSARTLLRTAARSIESSVVREARARPPSRRATPPAPSQIRDAILPFQDWSAFPDVPVTALVSKPMADRLARNGIHTIHAFSGIESSRFYALTMAAPAKLARIRARASDLYAALPRTPRSPLPPAVSRLVEDVRARERARRLPTLLSEPLIDTIRNDLDRIPGRLADAFVSVIGLGGAPRAPLAVARRYGVGIPQVQALMAEARDNFQALSGWPDAIARRIAGLVPVTAVSLSEEPWAEGLSAADLERIALFALGPVFNCIEIGGERWLTPYNNQRWAALLDEARGLLRAAPKAASHGDLCRLATRPLGPAARNHAALFLSALPLPPESVEVWRDAARGTLTRGQAIAWALAQTGENPTERALAAFLSRVTARVPNPGTLREIVRQSRPAPDAIAPHGSSQQAEDVPEEAAPQRTRPSRRPPKYVYDEPPPPDAEALSALAATCTAIAVDHGSRGLGLVEITRLLAEEGFTEENGMTPALILQGLAAAEDLRCDPDGRWRLDSGMP